MKFVLAALCVVAALAFVAESTPAGQGHYWILGKKGAPCPDNTHSYVSPCGGGQTMSERTCEEPVAREIGMICDMSRCDCDEPLVLDRTTNKCVRLEDCPKN